MKVTTCCGCNKKPDEIEEYINCGVENNCTPISFVFHEEGTYNSETGEFCCTSCYRQFGCPTSPQGWRAGDAIRKT